MRFDDGARSLCACGPQSGMRRMKHRVVSTIASAFSTDWVSNKRAVSRQRCAFRR
jgi:hypothetical protein